MPITSETLTDGAVADWSRRFPALDPVQSVPRAAYVHVPFCAHRCGYCDFTLVARRDELIPQYLVALESELRLLQQPAPVDTLFLGGGTPTHLNAAQLATLLDSVTRWFPLPAVGEFSVEVNPSGLTAEKVAVLAERGVNRISLGVQSFDAQILATLERDHRSEDVFRAVELVRQRIDNVSLDLIFGVPGLTVSLWRETLQQAVRLSPRHLSAYGLTIEKGTAFWGRREKGSLPTVPDEVEREMYAVAMDELSSAGYPQYELSNYARPGFECQHNGVYWAGRPYFAVGPGAARYLGGRRETNHRSVTTWIRRIQANQSPVGDAEELAPVDRARETAVLNLRRMCGINRTIFAKQTGFELDALLGEPIARFRALGLLEDVAGNVRLTREGKFLADAIIVELL